MATLKNRTCRYCGKEFIGSGKQHYCEGPHFFSCVVCGKEYEIDPRGYKDTCSDECLKVKRNKKRRETCLKRYGTEIASQSSKVKKKLSDSAYKSLDKRNKTCLERYGVSNAMKNPDVSIKVSRKLKSKESREKFIKTNMDRFGVPHAMQNPEIFKKNAISKKRTTSDGIVVDSSYEQMIYDFCVRNNIKFETQIPIEYEYNGSTHITYIDFCIDGILFEVKGGHLLSGIFSHQGVPISQKIEIYKKNHVVVITDNFMSDFFGRPNSTESNGFKYLDKCPYPLIGVDINLFSKEPDFPYREDRPKIFYDVVVDNQRSSKEAFYDESIRWKMILNRVQYSGGFIDGKQILNALNITRTCKQPSWFSKEFAKNIISNYITSDIIVDPFAGWGARHDASVECGKIYIGSDANEELVKWHHSLGRSIELLDAKEFKFEKTCSVFICPPYQDKEVYIEDQDNSMTQCDWLQLVMNNVPNAKEYVMVCKLVDPGWEKYVVDTKINKSHFGKNYEYIVVVPGTDSSEFTYTEKDLEDLRRKHESYKELQKIRSQHKRKSKESRKWIHFPETMETKSVPESLVDSYISCGWKIGRGVSYFSGKIRITNGTEEKLIFEDDLPKYIERGWKRGRPQGTTNGMILIHRDDHQMMIPEKELDKYLKQGYVRGSKSPAYNKGKKRKDNTDGSYSYVDPSDRSNISSTSYDILREWDENGNEVYWVHNDSIKKNRRVNREDRDKLIYEGWEKGQKRYVK